MFVLWLMSYMSIGLLRSHEKELSIFSVILFENWWSSNMKGLCTTLALVLVLVLKQHRKISHLQSHVKAHPLNAAKSWNSEQKYICYVNPYWTKRKVGLWGTWLFPIQKVKYGLTRNLVGTLWWCPFQALNKMTIFSRFYQWTSPIMGTLHSENLSNEWERHWKREWDWQSSKLKKMLSKNVTNLQEQLQKHHPS